mgnify:CR=1 FL=1
MREFYTIIIYENTYMQNSGVDYVSSNLFDVVSILGGTIISIEENDILGTFTIFPALSATASDSPHISPERSDENNSDCHTPPLFRCLPPPDWCFAAKIQPVIISYFEAAR